MKKRPVSEELYGETEIVERRAKMKKDRVAERRKAS
jgi:hypothetical protein